MKRIAFILLLLITFEISNTAEASKNKKPATVIFDTDAGNDIDDVLALQMLLNYEKAGKIKLLGVTICKSNPNTIKFLDGYCRYNNRKNIPLGYAYNGVTPEDGTYLLPTLHAKVNGFPVLKPVRSIESKLPEGYKLIRKLLAGQPDTSVLLIAVGPLTNIGRLMNSQADEISPLTGVELVRKKVKLFSTMAGLYTNVFDFPEWNVISDLEAAKTTFAKCPVKLIASGWEVGNKLLYPHKSILNDFGNPDRNPLCIAYQSYMKMPYDRQTWDLTSVLDAVEPDKSWFIHSQKGTISIGNDGKSTFIESETGMHQYLTIPEEKVPSTLETLVNRVTGKNNKK